MTLWPTRLLTYVWPTPMRPLMMGMAIMADDEHVEQEEVLLRDGHVDEQLQEVRVDDAQEAGDDDGRHDHQRPAAGRAGRRPRCDGRSARAAPGAPA